MADLDTDPLSRTALPHDGEVRCRLCASADPTACHEWCQAISGLLCESCCQRILLGDLERLMSAAMGGPLPESTLRCAECERGQRWITGHVLSAIRHVTRPS